MKVSRVSGITSTKDYKASNRHANGLTESGRSKGDNNNCGRKSDDKSRDTFKRVFKQKLQEASLEMGDEDDRGR